MITVESKRPLWPTPWSTELWGYEIVAIMWDAYDIVSALRNGLFSLATLRSWSLTSGFTRLTTGGSRECAILGVHGTALPQRLILQFQNGLGRYRCTTRVSPSRRSLVIRRLRSYVRQVSMHSTQHEASSTRITTMDPPLSVRE